MMIQKFEWVIQKSETTIQKSELAIQYQSETASHTVKQIITNLNQWVIVLDVIINIQKLPPEVFYKKKLF